MLDSTDPGTIEAIERRIDPARTLFVVSSKSGTTVETLSFYSYFRAKVETARGDNAGDSFVAITDPGTPLQKLAAREGFRHTFFNMADIGGRDSALSYFGVVPAALMGLDIAAILASARPWSSSASPIRQHNNPACGSASYWPKPAKWAVIKSPSSPRPTSTASASGPSN